MFFARKFGFFVTCAAISLVLLAGCPKPKKTPPVGSRPGRTSGQGTNEQIFSQSIDSLNHLENHFGQDSLTQILTRLEGWLVEQSPDPAWQEDAFFAVQEKSLTALAENLARFAKSLEKIVVADPQANAALTSDDIQNAADMAKTLVEQLTAVYQALEVRHFPEYIQRTQEMEGILKSFAGMAKSRNLSEDDIRRFFQGLFPQLSGNTMQLVLYYRDLSETMNYFAETFRGAALNFRRLDGDYLKQAFWSRSIAQWAGGSRQEEIEEAKELFDWTVRNIMLQSTLQTPQREVLPAMPQMPWETLLFGKGSTSDWAFVFVELLRQHRIDACLFLSNFQDAQGQVTRSPWGVGVLIDGKVHLFLVRYGVPLVAEGEISLDREKGLVFGQVATFDQLQADPGLLAAYLGDRYSAEQVKVLLDNTTLAIPADPVAHSQRMAILEKALTGANKTVLSAAWPEQKQRFENALLGMTVTRWNYLFEAQLQACLTRSTQDMRLELFRLAPDPKFPNPLWKGRVLYLSGRKTGEGAAAAELQHACISERELKALLDRQRAVMSEPMNQLQAQLQETGLALQGASEADKPDLETKLRELQRIRDEFDAGMATGFQMLQIQASLMESIGGTANYWLGQVHFEEALHSGNAGSRKGSLSAAYDYVSKRIIDNPKAQQWWHGARYHLARVCETQEKYEEASRYYLMPSPEPDSIGRQFRARQLQRLAMKE